ncbi:hypothetical protein Poli38472_005457 [Pythium oligandrum]|uniref:Uncharacterized protein n=1 Tax=Pythium oligandrum TaxID=41045 RepID=A0A8K1CGX7_PYTOL|nr:hypothetical protein Poli38472_005457 [Pythium oligandrum]|eukprot:TMW62839.1 hypothetical protein Poli38472_005457 [Pythium oligandrum]
MTGGVRRRWSSNQAPKDGAPVTERTVTGAREASPGTMRIRRGSDPRAKELEMDTTISRIMGSDWGDRSKQPVSLAMRFYWVIFTVVLANGAYTYFTGKDESYLVEKVQKKVDERLGRVETDEFIVMADSKPSSTASAIEKQPTVAAQASAAKSSSSSARTETPDFSVSSTRAPPASMFTSKPAPTTMPFLNSPTQARPRSKADFEAQLQQMRSRQAQLNVELKDRSQSFRSVEDLQAEIKRIDLEKAQIKQAMKKL